MLFDGWDEIGRVLSVGILAYAGLVVLLRVSGNRTLSKMNSFDLVVTVAFGSTLSTILVNKSTSLATGLAAIALLVLLQLAITWVSVRSLPVSRLVKTTPTVLLRDGCLHEASMKDVRVTADEIRAAVRKHGFGALEHIAMVVLESDGSLSVIPSAAAGNLSACEGLRGGPRNRAGGKG